MVKIKIAQYTSKIDGGTKYIEVAKKGNKLHYINFEGDYSYIYSGLNHAKNDIQDCYKTLDNFKMLV